MAKSKNVVLRTEGKTSNLYIIDAIAYYASVHKPKEKYQSTDKEYSITLFVDEATKDALIDLPVNSAKVFAEVGVDKIKKGKRRGEIKYPSDTYPEGLFGFSVTCPEFSKAGNPRTVKVIGKDGKDIEDMIGNGSKVTVKCLAYTNQDEEWNIQLSLVQVLDLVPYEGGGGEVTDDILGVSYSVGSKKAGTGDPVLDGDDDVPPFDTADEDDY